MDSVGLTPVLRGAFEATGSPGWIMRIIQERGLDRRNGFRLKLALGDDVNRRSFQATIAAIAAGEADFIDADWISLSRCRQQGLNLVAVHPYGRIMGAVVVPASSPIRELADVRERRIGVVGRLDKNWMVIRAACRSRHGFDPQSTALVEEAGSKAVLVDWLEADKVDAAVVYWHMAPGLAATGRFRQLCDVLDLLPEPQPGPPTTFFAFREAFVASDGALVAAFVAAYRDAVAVMRADRAAWPDLALPPKAFAALRTAWDRRICVDWGAGDIDRLERLFDQLKAVAGAESLGIDKIAPGLFAPASIM